MYCEAACEVCHRLNKHRQQNHQHKDTSSTAASDQPEEPFVDQTLKTLHSVIEIINQVVKNQLSFVKDHSSKGLDKHTYTQLLVGRVIEAIVSHLGHDQNPMTLFIGAIKHTDILRFLLPQGDERHINTWIASLIGLQTQFHFSKNDLTGVVTALGKHISIAEDSLTRVEHIKTNLMNKFHLQSKHENKRAWVD